MRKKKENVFIKKLKEIFSADVRALALFRIGLAVLIILDLINRARNLRAHYTDFGVLPRDVYLEKFANVWYISIHLISGELIVQILLFIIAGIFAIALLFGYKTRIVTIVSWFLLISLQNRNPMVLQGGDILFRMLLFWAMFLPLGVYWSLDRKLKKSKSQKNKLNEIPKRIFSIGVIGVFLQVVFLFIFTALFKTGKEWFPEGSAIYYALSIDQFTTSFGYFLLNFPLLLQGLTYFILFFWYIGIVLLFMPLFNGPLRSFAVFIFIFIQIGMGLTMMLGLFPLIVIVAMFPFLPSWFWDKFLPKLRVKKYSKLNLGRLSGTRSYFNFKNPRQVIVIVLGAFFIIYIFLWNLQTLGAYNVPNNLEWIGYTTRVDQKWNMFSPYPLKEDGWYVIPGNLKSGEEVDLFKNYGKGGEVSFEKPEFVSATYKNQRWRKYMMNLWSKNNREHRIYYGKYLCRNWNSKHQGQDKLDNFEIIFMKEVTLPDYQEPKVEKVVIWEHYCFGKPANELE